MATVTCTVTINDANGQTIESRPSTNKTYAKQYGSRKAKEIGGTYEVKPVTPVEYKPEDWN